MTAPHHRTSLAIGWQAARANLAPALFIQAVMLALLIGYYVSPAVARTLQEFADYKLRHGLVFVVLASIAAGALVPELFLIVFFQRGRPFLFAGLQSEVPRVDVIPAADRCA